MDRSDLIPTVIDTADQCHHIVGNISCSDTRMGIGAPAEHPCARIVFIHWAGDIFRTCQCRIFSRNHGRWAGRVAPICLCQVSEMIGVPQAQTVSGNPWRILARSDIHQAAQAFFRCLGNKHGGLLQVKAVEILSGKCARRVKYARRDAALLQPCAIHMVICKVDVAGHRDAGGI